MYRYHYLIWAFFSFCFVMSGQTTDVEYRETPTTEEQDPKDKSVFYFNVGFQQNFGMNFEGLQTALRSQNINLRPFNGAPLMGSFQFFSRADKVLFGTAFDFYSLTSDFSPGTASLVFQSTNFFLGYQVFSHKKWSFYTTGGLTIQTVLLDVEIQSPSLNFNTALNSPTKTTLSNIGLGGQLGVQVLRTLGKHSFIGFQAGYAGALSNLGWFYNNTRLADAPEIKTSRAYVGIQLGMRFR
jgi:hypothetical protein